MKKIFLLFAFLLPILLQAQITITTNQLPYAGLGYVNANDTSFILPNFTVGGANQTWNFSAVLTNDQQDTAGWTTAVGTPYTADFPTSNLASDNQTDSIYSYYTSNANGFYLNGFRAYGSNTPFSVNKIVMNPAYLFMPVPFTFGDTQSSYFRFVIDVDTALPYYRLVHRVNQTFNVPAYGSLQLPNATYPNTICVKNVQTSFDSISIDVTGLGLYIPVSSSASQLTNYYWARTAQPSIVLTIVADSLGNNTETASYFEGTAVTGIESPTVPQDPNVTVYPNPASDLVYVNLPQPGNATTVFRLTDVQGRVVRETSLEGIQQYGFYVNRLPVGMYLWTIEELGATGKLIVK